MSGNAESSTSRSRRGRKEPRSYAESFDYSSENLEEEDRKPVIKKRKTGSARGGGGIACIQCRARKLHCDLTTPACGSCAKKGEEHACSFQNMLYYENPEDAPAAKLKASVDRLEAMMLALRAGSASSANSSASSSPRVVGSPVIPPIDSSSPPPTTGRTTADVLSKLLLTPTFDPAAKVSATVDLYSIASALQYAPILPTPTLPQLAEPSSRYSRPSSEAFSAVLSIIPTPAQSYASLDAFFQRQPTLGAFPIVHRGRFMAQCQALWDSGHAGLKGCDPHWLATYLALNGLGLLGLRDDEAVARGMPSGEGKALLARSWLDGAMQALFSGEFLATPSLESVRAVVLLNCFWASWQGGSHLLAAMSFNTAVIASAFELELHRDPDELEHDFVPLEAEERRRVFWALFSYDTIGRAFLGKTYSPLSASSITVKPPSLSDDAFIESGVLVKPSATVARLCSLPATILLLAQPKRTAVADLAPVADEEAFELKVLREFAHMRSGQLGARDSCCKLLGMLESISQCSSSMGELIVAIASSSAAITLATETSESSRLVKFMHQLEMHYLPSDLQPLLQRCMIVLHQVVPPSPTPPTAPPSLYYGGGQSPGSTDSSFLGTPQTGYLYTGYDAGSSNPHVSDSSSMDLYGSSHRTDQTLHNFTFDFTVPPSFLADAPLFGSCAVQPQKEQPCPLLKPWLAKQHEWGFASPNLATPHLQDLFC